MAHPGGRPKIFETPEDLQEAVDKAMTEMGHQPTVSGLAYQLGIGRRTLYEYADREEFSHIIKRAIDFVEMMYETRLVYVDKPVGVIFALKNMGWKDTKDLYVTTPQLPDWMKEGEKS